MVSTKAEQITVIANDNFLWVRREWKTSFSDEHFFFLFTSEMCTEQSLNSSYKNTIKKNLGVPFKTATFCIFTCSRTKVWANVLECGEPQQYTRLRLSTCFWNEADDTWLCKGVWVSALSPRCPEPWGYAASSSRANRDRSLCDIVETRW